MSMEGWGFPGLSRKAHYFDGGRSICGKWLYMGNLDINQTTGDKPGPDDCRECHRRLLKRKAMAAGAAALRNNHDRFLDEDELPRDDEGRQG